MRRRIFASKEEVNFAIDEVGHNPQDPGSHKKEEHSCRKKNPGQSYNLVKRTYRSLYKLEIHFALLEKKSEKPRSGQVYCRDKGRKGKIKWKAEGFREDEHGTLWFEKRVYVHNDPETRKVDFFYGS